MKIFVTGGTGNIGQHVTLALAARGHQVELLTRTPERIPAFQSMEEHIRWNLDRAKAKLAGETLHDPVHSY